MPEKWPRDDAILWVPSTPGRSRVVPRGRPAPFCLSRWRHSIMYGTPLDAPCHKAHHSHLNRINPTTYAREMASNSSGLTSRVISGLLNFDEARRHCSPRARLGSFDGLAHVSRAPTTAQDAHLHRWVPMAMVVALNSSGLTSRVTSGLLNFDEARRHVLGWDCLTAWIMSPGPPPLPKTLTFIGGCRWRWRSHQTLAV